jgi:hypothetical protein
VAILSANRKDIKQITKSKKRFASLCEKARKQGLSVRIVPQKKLRDYVGMNDLAAKAIGFPSPKKTIMLSKASTLVTKGNTLKHELEERRKMSNGEKYWPAHVFALKHER